MKRVSETDSGVNTRLGLIQVHSVAVLVGLTGLFGKLLTVSPAIIVAGRTVFGSLALLAAIRLTGANVRVRSRKDFAILMLCGAILALHWYSFFRAIQVSTVAVGVLGFSSFPAFVTLLEPLVSRERLHLRDVLTALLVVIGLAVVTPSLSAANHVTLGMAWSVFSGFLYAVLSLLSRSLVRAYPAITVTLAQQATAALLTVPVALASATPISLRTLLLLAALGVVFTAFAQGLLVASLKHIRAQTASVVVSLEPVYGILFAFLFLGEVPNARTLLGGLLIVAAVIGASLKGEGTL
jgi:drug/metabolite transporter (DMT)-like permease